MLCGQARALLSLGGPAQCVCAGQTADGQRQTVGYMPTGSGMGGGEWGKEQGSLGTSLLNWAIHLYRSKLEPLAEWFSSIKALQSLRPGGGCR